MFDLGTVVIVLNAGALTFVAGVGVKIVRALWLVAETVAEIKTEHRILWNDYARRVDGAMKGGKP